MAKTGSDSDQGRNDLQENLRSQRICKARTTPARPWVKDIILCYYSDYLNFI